MTGQIARVVFDPLAHPRSAQHLKVKLHSSFKPLRLDELARVLEKFQPLLKLLLDPFDRRFQALLAHDELARRIENKFFYALRLFVFEHVQMIHRLYLVAEKLDPKRLIVKIRGIDIDHVAVYAKIPAIKKIVVAFVTHIDELAK